MATASLYDLLTYGSSTATQYAALQNLQQSQYQTASCGWSVHGLQNLTQPIMQQAVPVKKVVSFMDELRSEINSWLK